MRKSPEGRRGLLGNNSQRIYSLGTFGFAIYLLAITSFGIDSANALVSFKFHRNICSQCVSVGPYQSSSLHILLITQKSISIANFLILFSGVFDNLGKVIMCFFGDSDFFIDGFLFFELQGFLIYIRFGFKVLCNLAFLERLKEVENLRKICI